MVPSTLQLAANSETPGVMSRSNRFFPGRNVIAERASVIVNCNESLIVIEGPAGTRRRRIMGWCTLWPSWSD